jgi:hypothetical protein
MKKWILAFIVCLLVASPVVALADGTTAGTTLSPTENLVLKFFPSFPTLCGDYFYSISDGASAIGLTTTLANWRFLTLKTGYITQITGFPNPSNIALLDLQIDLNTLLSKDKIVTIWKDLLNISLGVWSGLDLSQDPVKVKWGINATIIQLYFN